MILDDKDKNILNDVIRSYRADIDSNNYELIYKQLDVSQRSIFSEALWAAGIDPLPYLNTLYTHTIGPAWSKSILTIPGNIKTINPYSIYKNDNIKYIIIEPGVKDIQGSAIFNCHNVEYIKIPNTVKHIDAGAFTGGNKLRTLVLPAWIKGNSFYTLLDYTPSDCKVLYNKEDEE